MVKIDIIKKQLVEQQENGEITFGDLDFLIKEAQQEVIKKAEELFKSDDFDSEDFCGCFEGDIREIYLEGVEDFLRLLKEGI